MNAPVDAVSDATLLAEARPNAWSVSRAAGDTNGDGFDDLLLGVRQQDVAYLVLGPIQGTIDLADADVRLVAEAPLDDAGSAVASAGDVDGDGFFDLLVGAPSRQDYTGSAYLLFGYLW